MANVHGSPSWQRIGWLAVLVMAAHLLILQTSPASIGTHFDRDAKETKAFATRSIEAPPAPEPVAAPAPVPAPKKPAPRRALPPPADPVIEPASETVPPAVDSLASDTLPTPVDSTAATTATEEAAPLAAIPASAPADLATALPAGPQTTPVTAVKLPDSVLMRYQMKGTARGLDYHANSELGWINAGGNYEAYMKVSAFLVGARIMTSSGQLTQHGLAPVRFADKFRSEQAAHFLPDSGKISFSANTPDAPWIEGAQDRVSVFMQLSGMLAANPADFPPGTEVTLYTIGPRDADTWTFVIEDLENQQLPSGELLTLKLIRKPRKEFDQKVEIWYAPALGYLPVRNRITQANGDFIDQQLSNIERR